MQVQALVDVMEQIAPTRYAEAWDNVGLLAGDPTAPLTHVLLTIDLTPAVLDEAIAENAGAVVAYHPPIFEPLKRLTGGVVFDAIRHGIAIYSPHTAYDAAHGGTNDVLADILQLTGRRPLKLHEPKTRQAKLVTFAPEKDVENVSEALFAAGAGRIGNYSACSFRLRGTGTFFGEAGANPAVGQAGKLETADEIRIETVVPLERVSHVIAALRTAHPYEEPAFDLNVLAAPPVGVGAGRVGALPPATDRAALVDTIKKGLGVAHVLVAGPRTGEAKTAAVCAGAGGGLLGDVLRQKADVYLTGELRHHDALAAARAGVTAVCALHTNTERVALARLRTSLVEKLSGIEVVISSADVDPFRIV